MLQLLLVRLCAMMRMQDGSTPLILAASQGLQLVVELLVDKGATVGIKDKAGKTAFDWAQRNGHSAVADYLKRFAGTTASSVSSTRKSALIRLKSVFKRS
ncbi:unnamed protein product [Ostreobium quekettii]|uniref:Uncharacterized protein n=1 Tax=Ostreobium quekettii TaxID=121088 RepID=A0A8S1J3W2_9CHLO|nr:unnamed protein product [Ostreobium quekettii]